jgi:hypothetical protein
MASWWKKPAWKQMLEPDADQIDNGPIRKEREEEEGEGDN